MKNLIWLLVMAVAVFSTTPAYPAGEAENPHQSGLMESLGNDQPAKAKEIPVIIIQNKRQDFQRKSRRDGSRSRIYVAKMKVEEKLPPEALDRLGDRK